MNPERVLIHRGKDECWYFSREAGNGQITEQSEGYTRLADCERAAFKAHPDLPQHVKGDIE